MLVLAPLLLVSGPALACSCTQTLEHGYRHADHVLLARVTGARMARYGFEIDFHPVQLLKGPVPPAPLMTRATLLCGMSRVSVGAQYLFFVDVAEVDGTHYAEVGCGSFLVGSGDTRRKVDTLRRWASPDLRRREPPECERLRELDGLVAQLRRQYHDDHPDVVAALGLVEHAEAKLAPAHQGRSIRDVCRDGLATPPSAPGLGVVPDTDVLGEPVAVYE